MGKFNCGTCVRCDDDFNDDNLTSDAFGDSSVQMCNTCLHEIMKDNSKFALVESPEIYGQTFCYKNELPELIKEYGEKVIVLNN